MTGIDIKNQLSGRNLGDVLLLPSNMFRAGTDIFMDDLSIEDLSSSLNVEILKVDTDGSELLKQLLNR